MFSEKYFFESMKITKNGDAAETLLYNIYNITSTEIYFFKFRHFFTIAHAGILFLFSRNGNLLE